MSGIGAPQQHKQPSRKGKKAWRKNIDVTEVQDGLENLQKEIRSGGPLSEKKAEELFALDTVGSQEIKKKYNLQKPLKVDEILAQRSAVPSVDSRKRALPTGIYESSRKKQKGEWVSKKEVQRLKNSINSTSHLDLEVLHNDDPSAFDLWSKQPDTTQSTSLEYVPKPRSKVAPATIKRAPVAMAASGMAVRAVPNPIAGTSYNPTFEDWEDLVQKAGEKEVAAERARLQAAQMDEEKRARVAASAAEEEARQTDNESAWEGFETENEDVEMLKRKRPTRKSPAERNKAKRKKQAERLAKHEKKMGDKRGRDEQLQELADSSVALVSGSNKEVGMPIEEGGEDYDTVSVRRRRMGNTTIPQQNLELVLPDELQDSLRLLKPEGNLLQDRFRHLLVNGKIESRKPVTQPKKKRVKYTEKWSHKDFEIPV